MLNVSLICACELLEEKPINRNKENITRHLGFMISSPHALGYADGIEDDFKPIKPTLYLPIDDCL